MNSSTNTYRVRSTLLLIVLLAVSFAFPVAHSRAQGATLNIGYQRGGVWTLLKAQQTLEQRFPDVTITWTLFPAGPQLLEALNAGAIDIGGTGETPPIFAQAAGTPLLYVSTTLGSGAGQAIVVPENSDVQTVQDLRGKKIAFNKASSAHLLLIRALEQAGLTYADIEPIFLAPPEARAAFEGGSVDAWVIWNPFLAAAQQEIGARAIVNGETVSPTRGFTLASDRFVEEQPDLLIGIIEELQTWTAWIRENKDEYSEILAQETGVDVAVWRQSVEVEIPDVTFIDEETIAAQQEVADIFYELELIPEPLDIRAASWSPNGFAPAAESTAEATATNP